MGIMKKYQMIPEIIKSEICIHTWNDFAFMKDNELDYKCLKYIFQTTRIPGEPIGRQLIDVYVEDYTSIPDDKRWEYYQEEPYYIPMGKYNGKGFHSKSLAIAFSMAMSIYILANCHLEYEDEKKPIYLKNAMKNAVNFKPYLSPTEYLSLLDGLFEYHESDLDAWSAIQKKSFEWKPKLF